MKVSSNQVGSMRCRKERGKEILRSAACSAAMRKKKLRDRERILSVEGGMKGLSIRRKDSKCRDRERDLMSLGELSPDGPHS
jgi:hypothetical protein